jgi:hypothetical protein
MNTNILNIKTKIYCNDKEILEINTQRSYDDLRRSLLNNEKRSISNRVVLSYMNDFGEIVNLDQNSYNDFLQSTDGVCYHIEFKDTTILSNLNIIKQLTWQCTHCHASNDADRKVCSVCQFAKQN